MILELVEVMENEIEDDARKLGMKTSIYMFKEGLMSSSGFKWSNYIVTHDPQFQSNV
jgi:hypothetical protein